MVRTFNGKIFLKNGFEIARIDDIGVVEEDVEDIVQEKVLKSVSVVRVRHFETYDGCYSCLGKVSMQTESLAHCNRCGSVQLLHRCKSQTSARLELITSIASACSPRLLFGRFTIV